MNKLIKKQFIVLRYFIDSVDELLFLFFFPIVTVILLRIIQYTINIFKHVVDIVHNINKRKPKKLLQHCFSFLLLFFVLLLMN